MKKIVRIITALICLSSIQLQGMERPIIKKRDAIEASATQKAFMHHILKDYELDPQSCRILAYYDPNDIARATTNTVTNTIYLNEAGGSFDALELIDGKAIVPLDSIDLAKHAQDIYVGYHEVGHIKDRACQKIDRSMKNASHANMFASLGIMATCGYLSQKLLASKYPNSLLFQSVPVNIFGLSLTIPSIWISCSLVTSCILDFFTAPYAIKFAKTKATNASEIRADTLACEQLLRKQWGLTPISVYLVNRYFYSQNKNKGKSNGHDAIAEYNNIVQLLKKSGYDVVKTVEPDDQITMCIQNNHIKTTRTWKVVKK